MLLSLVCQNEIAYSKFYKGENFILSKNKYAKMIASYAKMIAVIIYQDKHLAIKIFQINCVVDNFFILIKAMTKTIRIKTVEEKAHNKSSIVNMNEFQVNLRVTNILIL
ncbi:hypothetical protein ENBRE01_3066 [Enteropsectra breve]|nr:hypothetical protein ENBRE01_3066 [Enteropsectra breve]